MKDYLAIVRSLHRLNRVLIITFAGMLTYSTLEWQHIVGGAHPFQPQRMMLISSAGLFGSIGQALGARRARASLVLTGLSILAVVGAFLVRR